MHANSKRLIVVTLGSLLFCVLSCIGFTQIAKLGSEGQAPIKTFEVTINVDQREKFFAKLRSFADDHAFKIIIRNVDVSTGPSGKGFFVEMLRDDVHIYAISNPSAPIMVSIGFHDADSIHPAPKQVIDELCIDLEESLSEVTNLSLTQPCSD
jgi:hypothetical protein